MNTLNKRYALLLLSFYLLTYILPLGARGLVVPDETRYGEIPREMIANGDWVVPHLNGLRYFEKPVLGYWVHAISILLFGENNFAVRLPSAMAVGLSALLIYIIVRRISYLENEDEGYMSVLSALIFLSCFEVFGVGNTAVLDSLFSFFVTASISAFYFASETSQGSAKENGFLMLSGLACGLAFLTKGFLAFAVPVLCLAPYLIWERRYADLLRMSWLPILIAVLVALPWSILIHLREPDFWRFFFWNEHVRRFMADNAQHKESFWFFFLVSPAMFMPWTFLIPAAATGMRKLISDSGIQGRFIRFSLCWLVMPFLFFSVSDGKLLTYILPCFPPFAILMAFGFSNIFKRKRKNVFQWGVAVTVIFFSLILLALMYVQLFGYQGFRPYGQPWKLIMFSNSLIVIIICCLWVFKDSKSFKKVMLIGLSPLLLFFIIHFLIPDLTVEKKVPGILLERNRQNLSHDTIIISDENTIRAVCWYLHRDDVYLLENGGELNYGLAYSDASGRLIGIKSAVGLIKRNRGKIILIARVKNVLRWQDQLPIPVFQDDSGPDGYVLWGY